MPPADLDQLLEPILAVRMLAQATLTHHEPMPPGTALVVTLDAEENGGAEHDLAELVAERVDRERFRMVLRPSLDEADRRQLRGCLQDTRVDHLLARVEDMQTVR